MVALYFSTVELGDKTSLLIIQYFDQGSIKYKRPLTHRSMRQACLMACQTSFTDNPAHYVLSMNDYFLDYRDGGITR